jgi:hypothetical protein
MCLCLFHHQFIPYPLLFPLFDSLDKLRPFPEFSWRSF